MVVMVRRQEALRRTADDYRLKPSARGQTRGLPATRRQRPSSTIDPTTAMTKPTGSPSRYQPAARPRNPPISAPEIPNSVGDDESTRVTSRHQELGDDSDDQTEDKPGENAHIVLLRAVVWMSGKQEPFPLWHLPRPL